MEKLSSVLKLINELFKKHNDKSTQGAGQGETGWVAAGVGPSPRLGWREGAKDATAPVLSCPVPVWGRLLAFSQKENH